MPGSGVIRRADLGERPWPRCKPGLCRLPDDKNEPTDYASYVEVIDKARDLMAPILGREVSEHLIETVFAIETIADIRQLRPLLQRG
jgi:hypothetical protein